MEKPIFRKAKNFTKFPRWLKIAGIGIITFALIIALMPLTAEWVAEKWMRDNGAKLATIKDIDFNIFNGKFILKGLEAGSNEGSLCRIASLTVDLQWWPLTKQRIQIEHLSLTGAVIDISKQETGGWKIGDLIITPLPPTPTASDGANQSTQKTWGIGIKEIAIQASRVGYKDLRLKSEIAVKRVLASNVRSWDGLTPTYIDADLIIDNSNFSFVGDVTPFAEEPRLTGVAKLTALDFMPYQTLLQDTAVKKLQGNLSFDIEIDALMKSQNSSTILAKGSLQLTNLVTELQAITLNQKQLNWNGDAKLQIPAKKQQNMVSLNGQLTLKESNVNLADANMEIKQNSFAWKGAVTYTPAADEQSPMGLTMQANSEINGLLVKDMRKNIVLGNIDNLALQDVTLDNLDIISIAQFSALKTRLIENPPTHEQPHDKTINQFLSLDELTTSRVSINNLNEIAVKNLQLAGLGVDVAREKDGQFKWLKQLINDASADNTPDAKPTPPVQPSATEVTASEPDKKPVAVAINNLRLSGNNWIKYTDETVEPAYHALLSPIQLSIKSLNSALPHSASPIELQAKLGEYTSVNVEGTISPFEEKLSADLIAKVSSFEVPQISAFVPAYDIKRGQLNATTSIKIKQGKLDIQNDLLVRKLKMIAKSKGEAGLVAEGLAMPLDVALDLLRDRKDQIKLKIPIQGDMEKPEFDLQNVINKATAKAMQKAALAYVKNALQPLGTILLVAKVAGKVAAPRFQPLSFQPGEFGLNTKGMRYLDKIAQLLDDRPRLNLTFCGVAVPADKKVMLDRAIKKAETDRKQALKKETKATQAPPVVVAEEELLRLAKQRSDTMRKYLVDKKNISPQRLFACKPTLSQDLQSEPRVEISL